MMSLFFKNITLLIALLLVVITQMHSQTGCTDLLATNYDSIATKNDGSCIYNPVRISVGNTYRLDSLISETSGLIYWNNMLWTHNDHGDASLYEIKPSDGTIVSSISLEPLINTDWEEISQDEDYVYVGDFGNNVNGNRTDLNIIRVSKNSILAGTPQTDFIKFEYEDQIDFTARRSNKTNYDCEAFIITETAIFLFTKEWLSNKTRVYKLPKIPGTYKAKLHDSYDVKGLITGAVYKKEKGIIALSGYNRLLKPFVFLLYDFTEENFFGGNKRKLRIRLPFKQVEGITTNDGLNYFISNEKFDVTGTTQELHTLDLSPYLEEYLKILEFKD